MSDLFPAGKEEGILRFLEALGARADGWQVMDHWEGDLTAVGVAAVGEPGRLAYVSSSELPEGFYFVELEMPAAGEVYEVVARDERCELERALEMVKRHLERE